MAVNRFEEAEQIRDALYRKLPSVNDLILAPAFQEMLESHGRERVVEAIRGVLVNLRNEIAAGHVTNQSLEQELGALASLVSTQLEAGPQYSLRPVINGTGVVLHTNLGRAPLSEAALEHIADVARDYSNLELDLETGERNRRDIHVERLVLRVLGVPDEDAERLGVAIVNNCAAATFLALNALAEGREVVVSRGELVEIGGGFRIPEILEKSGAVLREVGTTNRTRATDYENAVTEQTALLLRVHQSNFSIEGFVERPTLQELVSLARTVGVPIFEDQGTGLIDSLDRVGIPHQPTMRDSLEQGVDLVAASGDKLLGGPQCGVLVGRKDLIARIRKNPLLRTFRVDKLTYAALEATLLQPDATPLMRMLSAPAEEIERRCRAVADNIRSTRINVAVVAVDSVVGGGTAPSATIRSHAVAIVHAGLSAADVLKALRRLDPPIIGRIADGAVHLDLRTVPARLDVAITSALNQL